MSLFALCGCSTGHILCELALKPKFGYRTIRQAYDLADERYPGVTSWYDSLHTDGVFKDTVIIGEKGAPIHAVYAGLPEPDGSALVLHGYGSNHIGMMHLARMYRDSLNFNVILPDLQYHGYSAGVTGMGWYDRLDALRWLGVMDDLWHDDFVVVHGVSMGAATTMMLSGEAGLPRNVRCLIEDCGYTSVWEQFDTLRIQHSHLKEKVLQKTSDYCYKKYGWSFKEASAVNQLAKCDRPMLFIHGNPDRFVPVDFVYRCYDAKKLGYKEIWVEPDTPEHARMFMYHTQQYVCHVRSFIDKVRQM